jgi:TolA-binding protein
MEKILTMLVGLLIALGGWSLSRTFELSTIQAVHNNKIEQLEIQLRLTEEKISEMSDSDEEIMEQHEELFKKLQEGNAPSTGYSYN